MTPQNAWVYAVLPFVTMVALTVGFIVVFRQRSQARRAAMGTRPSSLAPSHPWWANPWVWLGVTLVSVVLGVFVWPGLFGFMFIVIPFVWIRRPRRQSPVDPRGNGHAHRDAGLFKPD